MQEKKETGFLQTDIYQHRVKKLKYVQEKQSVSSLFTFGNKTTSIVISLSLHVYIIYPFS